MIASSGIIASVCTYASYQYWKKRRQSKPEDEGFEEVSKVSWWYDNYVKATPFIHWLDGLGAFILSHTIQGLP